jgi:hypothetical protein
MTTHIAPVIRGLLLAIALAPASGCFQYAQIPVSALEPGMDVRAQLSGIGAERLRRGGEVQARVVQGFTLNGAVVGLRGDSVLFSVPLTLYEGDYRARTLTQEVLLARGEMASTEIRQLSRSRTMLAVVGAGAATIAGIVALTRNAGASGGIPINGGPGEIRLPVRIGWRLP